MYLGSFVPRAAGYAPGSGVDLEEPYFLFVGRLERIKGLQTLFPVFKRYRKAKLLVAGAGRYGQELRELARGANVHFLGHVAEAQLNELYRNAVAVIVPSIWYEIFPLVMLEAFRQQTPVVARKLGAMVEVIEESGGGVLYESDDELLAAMDRLLEDRSYRTTLGMSGYQAYEQKWTAEAHLDRYLALIQELAARRRPPLRAHGRVGSHGGGWPHGARSSGKDQPRERAENGSVRGPVVFSERHPRHLTHQVGSAPQGCRDDSCLLAHSG